MVATKPVDFRKGHDGLAALVKNELRKDAVIGRMRIEGALFLRQPRPFLLPRPCEDMLPGSCAFDDRIEGVEFLVEIG